MAKMNQPTKAELLTEVEDLHDLLDEIADVAVDEEGDPEEQLNQIADLAEEDEDNLDSDGSEEEE